jgi:hypothetical protein
MNVMSKTLHIVNESGAIVTRRLYDPAVAATQEHPVRYNSRIHFMKHETSAFLEHVLGDVRYIQFTAHALGQEQLDGVINWLSGYARNGVKARTGAGDTPETWRFLYGHYTDKGTMYMVPADDDIKNLDDLGVHVVDPQKAPKYFKRVAAPYQYAIFGSINSVTEDDLGQIIEFELDNGYVGTHRNIELDRLVDDRTRAACDGIMLARPEFLTNQVGVHDRDINTYSFKGTTFNPLGVGKGIGHAKKGLEFDVVSYGAKKALVFDEFFFGILGASKPGDMFRSDLQSMVNFEEYEFALDSAQRLMKKVSEGLRNTQELKGFLLNSLRNVSKVKDDPSATEQWMLISALEAGMDVDVEPGLFRRAVGHFMYEVLQCEKGRIPMDHLGQRNDLCPDPHMFDKYGEIHLDWSVIPSGKCVCMDVPTGPIVAYRQPNGMALEHTQSVNQHMREFDNYNGRRKLFYGPDLLEVLEPMNGADLDDAACVMFDPDVVKHISSLTYPVTEKITIQSAPKKTVGRYYDIVKRAMENAGLASYTAEDFINMMKIVRTMTVKLGGIVNDIMLDTALSGRHKENMMSYLAAMIQAEQDKDRKIWLLDRREWLANREDYQLRHVATNLEAIIDFCVQGKGNPRQFDDMVKLCADMRAGTEVFPMFFAKQGTGFLGQGRISAKRQLGIDYVLAPSLLCKALGEVEDERNQFVNDLKAYEWECVTFVPMEVEAMFGYSRDMSMIARDIRRWFGPKAVAAMSLKDAAQRRAAYNEVLYGAFHICQSGPDGCPVNCPNKGKLIEDGEGLKQIMETYDMETRMFLAVEMKRLVHHNAVPSVNEDGSVRGVSDGAFANNVMFNYYLAALDATGVTGKYVPVELDHASAKLGLQGRSIEVVIENGNVLRKTDHYWIGTADVDNGDFMMVNGQIEVRKPNEEITSDGRGKFGDGEGISLDIE